jgi:hypothetical protein
MRHASIRDIGLSVSTPVRPRAERKRGDFFASRIPDAG